MHKYQLVNKGITSVCFKNQIQASPSWDLADITKNGAISICAFKL